MKLTDAELDDLIYRYLIEEGLIFPTTIYGVQIAVAHQAAHPELYPPPLTDEQVEAMIARGLQKLTELDESDGIRNMKRKRTVLLDKPTPKDPST